MGEETLSIGGIIRRIEILEQEADRCLRLARNSKSGNSNYNVGLLQKGQEIQRQIADLIEQNLVPILQQLNPSQVGAALAAANFSPTVMAEVTRVLTAARAAIAGGALTTAEIVGLIEIAVPVLCVITAAAIFTLALNAWLNRDQTAKNEKSPLAQEYERQISRAKHIPFQPRFMPRNA